MKYSILIPSYDPIGKNKDMFLKLIESIEANSLGKDYEIVIRKNGASYTDSHNDALLTSRGDYIVVLNDDVLIEDLLWLEKLTNDESIVSWRETDFGLMSEKTWDFACWAMARPLFNKIGLFDTKYREGIGFEDNDYHYKAKSLGIEYVVNPVKLVHYGGKVLADYFGGEHGKRERNHSIFYDKWIKK